MSSPIPTLTGWISDLALKADYMIGCFFVNEASQSYVYYGKIGSIADIVAKYGNDLLRMQERTKTILAQFLEGSFDQVAVDCQVSNTDTQVTGRVDVTVTCQITDNGVTQSLGYLCKMQNGVTVKIFNLNNTGVA
jgi:hypothetical protein